VADYAESLRRALEAYGPLPIPLYHLGNNRLHAEIYRRALEEPGVIVLHDAVLHHFLLGALTREQYIDEFVYNYSEWKRHLAEELWAERSSSAVDLRYFEFPLLRRVVEKSRAVIVHNPGAADIAQSHGARNLHIVPHFFEPVATPDAATTAEFRDRLGIPQTATLFGIFGYLRETKRVMASLDAFRRLNLVRPDTALLLAGDPVSPDLTRLLNAETRHPGVYRLGYLKENDFQIASAAIDCCINLRYPAAGETSGIAVRMMGIGKPVILSDGSQNADIPAAACLRVQPGVAEAAELFNHMVMVSAFPQFAKDLGNEARRHIREHHSLELAARRYWQILCAAASC
jgi:glycosyltransferase involved in cell wall biosynthesis